MRHTTGISDSYYRSTEHDLLEKYFKVAADPLQRTLQSRHIIQNGIEVTREADSTILPQQIAERVNQFFYLMPML
jgi:hypothetical protein